MKNGFNTPLIEIETIETLSSKLLALTGELSEKNAELIRLKREREEMIANISHDLRAPITAIRSTIDYLLGAKDLSPEEEADALQLIDRRTRTLENLIQDMYYLFCVEDTARPLNLEKVDAVSFLEECFYDITIDTRYDSHTCTLDVPSDLHCEINIDIQKMVRVLENLFTNAAKYTQADSHIVLHAELKNALLISISDNGPGISEEALPNIFNRTYTVSSARTPGEEGGSGLGLAIVKAIVDRHNGEINCSSSKDGSCFTIELPVA